MGKKVVFEDVPNGAKLVYKDDVYIKTDRPSQPYNVTFGDTPTQHGVIDDDALVELVK